MTDYPPPPSAYVFTIPLAQSFRFQPENNIKPYRDLTPKEEAIILELFEAMGKKGYAALFSDQNHMRQLGNEIKHVHPLTLLSVLFSPKNPDHTQYVGIIMDDWAKRKGFLEGNGGSGGLGSNLTRECEKGKVFVFLNDFASDIGVPVEELKPFFEKRDWEGLVRFIVWWKGSRLEMKTQ